MQGCTLLTWQLPLVQHPVSASAPRHTALKSIKVVLSAFQMLCCGLILLLGMIQTIFGSFMCIAKQSYDLSTYSFFIPHYLKRAGFCWYSALKPFWSVSVLNQLTSSFINGRHIKILWKTVKKNVFPSSGLNDVKKTIKFLGRC